jgi:hypothetical protein
MADPTKYQPGYDYSDFEQNNPTEPKPGGQLDNDFANIATSINETIDALKTVRRSDGKLANGIVTFDSLSTSIKAVLGEEQYLNIVGENIDSIVTVSDNMPELLAVYSNLDEIQTVLTIAPQLSTVSGIAANVSTVASIAPAVTANANNMAAIQAASGNANAAAASAALAQKWASNPEDTVVSGGLYSAFHWAKKATATVAGMLSKAGGTLTGDVLFGPGTGGKYSKLQANGDVQLNRGDNTGYNTWNVANAYFGWDGTRYVFGPAGPVRAFGPEIGVEYGGISTSLYPNGDIRFSGDMLSEYGLGLKAALKVFRSGNQPYVTNGSGSVGHGLGIKPSKLSAYLVCTTAQDGWAVGDEMEVGAFNYFNNASYGITFWADATNIYWRLAANGLVLISKANGTTFVAAPANFALRLRGSL